MVHISTYIQSLAMYYTGELYFYFVYSMKHNMYDARNVKIHIHTYGRKDVYWIVTKNWFTTIFIHSHIYPHKIIQLLYYRHYNHSYMYIKRVFISYTHTHTHARKSMCYVNITIIINLFIIKTYCKWEGKRDV